MAQNDKPESANEAQDHSQPLDDGGFFSLNDVIMAGRHQLTRSEQLLAADTRRNARNLLASAKLLELVVIVSLAMGVAAWAFLASLNIATDYREHHTWIYALLPVVGVATAWVYKNHGLAAKRGNNLVIDSALGTRLIHMRMAVLTFVCSTLTHLTGGSAGREGAAVQIGGTIASNISSLAHLKKHDHHDLMLAGISSAFGAVFGSPLAGAFFGMEMCFIGKIDYTAGIYCLVASFTGYFTSLALGTEYEANVIASVPNMTPRTVVIVVISAIIFGLTARLFAWSVRTVKSLYGRFITNYLVRALIGALVVLAAYARRLEVCRPCHLALGRRICRQHHPGGRSHQVGRHSAYPGRGLPRRRGHAPVWHRCGARRLDRLPRRNRPQLSGAHHHLYDGHRPAPRHGRRLLRDRGVYQLSRRRTPRRVPRPAYHLTQAPFAYCG